jgi:hypothetical protein
MFLVIKKTTAALLVAAAICAPAASARPIDRVLPPGATHDAGSGVADSRIDTSSVPPVQTVEASSEGFDWGDAGIGAAGMITLLSLGTGGLLVSRRNRERGRPATTSYRQRPLLTGRRRRAPPSSLSEDERSPILETVRSLAGKGGVALRYTCELQVAERISGPA